MHRASNERYLPRKSGEEYKMEVIMRSSFGTRTHVITPCAPVRTTCHISPSF
jgi:hypothetical protein